jgi:glycine/D-amino acid oxidase-like deaminating enzyme
LDVCVHAARVFWTTQNERADVCIVGAGIAGLTTAYLLTKAGKSVIVLDDGPVISGETERTTAHLVTVLDKRYCELEQLPCLRRSLLRLDRLLAGSFWASVPLKANGCVPPVP